MNYQRPFQVRQISFGPIEDLQLSVLTSYKHPEREEGPIAPGCLKAKCLSCAGYGTGQHWPRDAWMFPTCHRSSQGSFVRLIDQVLPQPDPLVEPLPFQGSPAIPPSPGRTMNSVDPELSKDSVLSQPIAARILPVPFPE